MFVGRAHNGVTPITDTIPTTSSSYPVLSINHTPAWWSAIADGQFVTETVAVIGYVGASSLYIDHYNQEIRYSGFNGNGGSNIFVSPYKYNTTLPLEGWYTCKFESYIQADRKLNNDSGDYGIYDDGITFLQQRWATWFLNGQQITPRYLCSNFTRPQDGSFDETIDPYTQKEVANYSAYNTYFREGMPMEFSSQVLGTYVTKPISVSSRFRPGFDSNISQQNLQFYSNNSALAYTAADRDYPIIAYADHTEAGAGFFQSDQFKRVIRTFENVNPDYCNRIP
jgi:hypothetical protein